jgi:hypothetical protein
MLLRNFHLCFIWGIIFLFTTLTTTGQSVKPRIIITADPELDDNNSLIRFLLYSSQFTVEGLIYASSQFHWKGDGKGTLFMVPGREYTRYGLHLCPCESYRWKKDERFIHEVVEAYANVYPNLRVHDPGYPAPELLKSKIRYGNIEFEGDFSKDSEGSALIKSVLLDSLPGPVYITAWGGQSTIARALKSIEEQYQQSEGWDVLKKHISEKVVILPSGDQDNTYSSYIQPHWPEVDYRQYRNGPNYGYGAQLVASRNNSTLLTAAWMSRNINEKGPLGRLYRVWGDGKQMVPGDRFDYFGLDGYTNEQLKQLGYIVWMPVQPKGSWLGEGDTGTFMNLLDNGLDALQKITPGGWGGRPFHPDPKTYTDPFSNDTAKVKDLVISAATLQTNAASAVTFPDFFAAAQQDFAARMDWSVNATYRAVNHPPVIHIQGSREVKAQPGDRIRLTAAVKDPDGNDFIVRWWQFRNTSGEPILTISKEHSLQTTIQIPKEAPHGQTLYLVLEVEDKGKMPLTRYQTVRIIL